MQEDLTVLDNAGLLLELGRERARAERRGCPVLAADGRREGVASPSCTCFRLNAIEAEIQRRLQGSPVPGGRTTSADVEHSELS